MVTISHSEPKAERQKLQEEKKGWKMKVNVGREKREWHKGTPLGKVLKILQDLALVMQVSTNDF